MSKWKIVGGVALLIIGFLILTICSSEAVHQYIWDMFNSSGTPE
ncbi:MAG: hypothetical protein WC248_06945 [Candidatus Methanomethylophilaceae archaeon]